MIEPNTVIHGDCLEVMKDIPDKSIDLVLTDPPYNIEIAKTGFVGGDCLAPVKDYGKQIWDSEPITQKHIDEMIRISKNQIIFGGNYYADKLPASSCWIVWNKLNTGNFADCELAWTSFDTAVRIFNYRWNGFIQQEMGYKKEERFHPTQKPVKLFKWIIHNYSAENMTILDPFAGSGTTALACIDLTRKYILIEKEKKYVDIIHQRIKKHTRQMRLAI